MNRCKMLIWKTKYPLITDFIKDSTELQSTNMAGFLILNDDVKSGKEWNLST